MIELRDDVFVVLSSDPQLLQRSDICPKRNDKESCARAVLKVDMNGVGNQASIRSVTTLDISFMLRITSESTTAPVIWVPVHGFFRGSPLIRIANLPPTFGPGAVIDSVEGPNTRTNLGPSARIIVCRYTKVAIWFLSVVGHICRLNDVTNPPRNLKISQIATPGSRNRNC